MLSENTRVPSEGPKEAQDSHRIKSVRKTRLSREDAKIREYFPDSLGNKRSRYAARNLCNNIKINELLFVCRLWQRNCPSELLGGGLSYGIQVHREGS